MRAFHVRLEAADVGASLACMSDEEQTAAFAAFAKELLRQCGTYHLAELQLAYVNAKLGPEERRLLAMLGHE